MGLPQSACKSLTTTEWRLPYQHTNQFLHCVVVESPQTAHFVMGVTKPVNSAQGKQLADKKGWQNAKNNQIRLIASAEGGSLTALPSTKAVLNRKTLPRRRLRPNVSGKKQAIYVGKI